jgi:hypothetical protein
MAHSFQRKTQCPNRLGVVLYNLASALSMAESGSKILTDA